MVILEIDRADAAGKQVEHGNGDDLPVKTVYLMVRAELLLFSSLLRFSVGDRT